MNITVALRYCPFSHSPGVKCVLPGSSISLQIYPTQILIVDLSTGLQEPLATLYCEMEGPVHKFTILQNLEQGWIEIFGNSKQGYFRDRLGAVQDREGMVITPIKGKRSWKQQKQEKWTLSATENQSFLLSPTPTTEKPIFYRAPELDRLSLGNHKKQDWDLINRRLDLTEILPIWLRLGQETKNEKRKTKNEGGTLLLLKELEDAIENRQIERIPERILDLYRAGFSGILTPQLEDEQHQGLSLPPISNLKDVSPLTLLQKGAQLIRSLFVQWSEDIIKILPALPIPFHCGRYINIDCGTVCSLDVEWSKKQLRRMILRPHETKTILLELPKSIHSYRIRKNFKDKEKIENPKNTLQITSGETLWLDNFKK